MSSLRIRVGVDLECMIICNPNDEAHPVRISNDLFEVSGWEGLVCWKVSFEYLKDIWIMSKTSNPETYKIGVLPC